MVSRHVMLGLCFSVSCLNLRVRLLIVSVALVAFCICFKCLVCSTVALCFLLLLVCFAIGA